MNSSRGRQSDGLLQRADIEKQYTWQLSDICATENDWEAAYKKARGLIDTAAGFTGKLDDPKTLFECLQTRSELSLTCDDLYQYAKLSQDLDSRVSKFQAMTDRAAMLRSQAGAAFAFVEPELLAIDDKRLRELGRQFPRTDIYDFYLEELIRSRAHIRSAEVEELLAQAGMIARGPDSIFTMLDSADIKYPSIKDETGNDVQLTKQRFLEFMQSSDPRIRADAHNAFYTVYEKHINTLGAALSAAVNKDVFFMRARKYDSSLHHALDAFNIPVSVYRSLIDTTEADLAGLHKWMELRKKILKLDALYPYDIICPLFPEQDYEVPYPEAVEEVQKAIAPLGRTYAGVLKDGFAGRWVDVYETEGKAGGAYSWRNYTSHPFVLMNYNGTVDNMFTLAHEMGHALHSYLANEKQPYEKAQYSIFVAEVASPLNEGLLLQHLLKKVTDTKQKLFLLNRHIDNTVATFFHQVMYAHFELAIHELVEKGEALSPDTMNTLWADLTKKYYGPAITMDSTTAAITGWLSSMLSRP